MRLSRFTIPAKLLHLIGLVILLIFSVTFANAPPWQGQYKIKPEQKVRFTAADVVGPDGIVYPNWTKCGVQGGMR